MFLKTRVVATAILAGLFAIATPSWAQSNNPNPNPSLNNVTPPAPNAAALGKFGDVPVGYSTGIPQITVPIYSYSNADKTLSMNISLDYHAGGVRVDEVASNAGIGFALNAGGVVSRTQRGISDEIEDYGFRDQMPIPSETEGNRWNDTNYFMKVAANVYDGQTDIFNYNFNGRSGKFMFGKNNDFLMLSLDPVKVETEMGQWGMTYTSGNNFKRFKITDEKGVTYVFDEHERTLSDARFTSWQTFVSSWYLTKVIAPFATDSIMLEYEAETYLMTAASSSSMTYGMGGFPSTSSGSAATGVTMFGKRIKSITFPNQVSVHFTYDTIARPEVLPAGLGTGMFRLKDISITDGSHTRGYHLYHDYSMNRLTLLKVLPYDNNGVEDKGYSFDYYKGDGHAGSILPERFSFQQDHWGFYNTNYVNGQAGGAIPREYFRVGDFTLFPGPGGAPDPDVNAFRLLPGGNRDVDTARVQCGTITKITYPTGGYTTYKMEANMADDPRLRQHIVLKNSSETAEVRAYCTDAQPGQGTFEFDGDPGSTTLFSLTFNPGIYNCSSSDQSSCKLNIEIRNAAGMAIFGQAIPFQHEVTVDYDFSLYDLAHGTYTLYVQAENVTSYMDWVVMEYTESHLNSVDSTVLDIYKPYVGGLRVKRIANYDGISPVPVSVREFGYVQEDGVTTSGGLGMYPVYTHSVYYQWHDDCTVWSGDGYNEYYGFAFAPNAIVRNSTSTQTLPSVNGSPVNYSRVVERQTDRGRFNGSTIRYLSSFRTSPIHVLSTFPFTPTEDHAYSYGQVDLEVILNEQNDTLRVTRNEYSISQNFDYTSPARHTNFMSVSLAGVKYNVGKLLCEQNNAQMPGDFWTRAQRPIYHLATTFLPLTGRKDLIKTTTTDYADGLKLKSEVAYTRDTYFNIKTSTTSTSKGHQVMQRLYYPHEYNTPVATAMLTRNMVGLPISAETWKTINTQQYLTGGFVSHYTSLASGIRPASADIFESAQPVPATQVPAFNAAAFNRAPSLFTPALTFSQYSARGFIAERAKVNDITQAILWDYNQQLPVAEVSNASLSQIAFTSFETGNPGQWSIAGNARDDDYARTGTQCYNLSSGSISRANLNASQAYIISYWSMNGTYTINGTTQNVIVPGKTVNGWTFYQHTVTTASTSITLSGSGRIDELRLYPEGAQMKTYTYNLLHGVSFMADANNMIAHYEYDGFGRLIYIRDDEGNVLKKIDYKYREQ